MNLFGSGYITPNDEWQQQRLLEIREAAYYLSTHRAAENRSADPERDWLNAEWIVDHSFVYNNLRSTASSALELAWAPTYVFPFGFPFTRLPSGEENRKILLGKLESHWHIPDLESALRESKTFAGLMESIVTQIRCHDRNHYQ